jgi:hypothetical protein
VEGGGVNRENADPSPYGHLPPPRQAQMTH